MFSPPFFLSAHISVSSLFLLTAAFLLLALLVLTCVSRAFSFRLLSHRLRALRDVVSSRAAHQDADARS